MDLVVTGGDRPLPPCGNCGLPAPAGERFCCYGCELAASIRAEADADHGHLYGTLCLVAILSMVVMMLSLFLYAEDVFDASGDVEMAWMRSGYRWASAALATPVMLLAGWPLIRRAAARCRSMDALIALGACSAYLLSCVALARGQPAVYFETATTALALATLGRYLEATARSHASRSLGPLLEVSRQTVLVREETGDRRVAAAEVEPGMRLRIDADQVVPVDLELQSAHADVDLAVLTGESRPVTLARGDTVPAGAVACGQALEGRALRATRDSALERLSDLARSLSEHSSAGLRRADAFASGLGPAACVIALTAGAYGVATESAGAGISRGLAVLLAACPCAYAIASPLVYWLALRAAFSRGVLIRSADALEALARVRTVAFDKTGTLTRPDTIVARARHADDADPYEVLGLVRALEEGSTHPVGRALRELANGRQPAPVMDRRFLPGRGVSAVDGAGRAVSIEPGETGDPVLMRAGVALARFELTEELRPEAAAAVSGLGEQGLDVVVLSGDGAGRVEAIGRALGVVTRARLTPEQKVVQLAVLGDGTAMVGDGVNDAPALAGRLTSFTLSGAAPLAKGLAQVTLLDPDLALVPWTIGHARRALAVVRGLLVAATLYNLVFVALGAAGLLKPAWAGLSMLGSSLLSLGFASSVGGLDDVAEAPARLATPRDRADGAAW